MITVLLFDNLGSGRIQKKYLIFHLESGAFLMHFTLFSCFFRPANRTTNVMTTNTSKHSPTEYNARCGVIISSKRYARTHLRCMLDVPENSCVPLLTARPPPPVKITRRAAAEIVTSAQGSSYIAVSLQFRRCRG